MSITFEPTTERVKTRRGILLHAAELIEEHGYMSGSEGMHVGGRLCLMGAVGMAMGGTIHEGMPHWDYTTGSMGHADIYDYGEVEEFLGAPGLTPLASAWYWSDTQQHEPNPAGSVARALRRMADGETFAQATGP